MFLTNSLLNDFLNTDTLYNTRKNSNITCYSDKTDTSYTLTLAVPGFQKTDISLETTTTTHTHTTLHLESNITEERLAESPFLFNFKTKFHIPRGYNTEEIIANLENGILTIDIPKSNVVDLSRTITID